MQQHEIVAVSTVIVEAHDFEVIPETKTVILPLDRISYKVLHSKENMLQQGLLIASFPGPIQPGNEARLLTVEAHNIDCRNT